MYRHRPDVISFVFGLLFTVVGVLTIADPVFNLQPQLLLPLVGVALGLGVIGSLITGTRRPTPAPRAAPAPTLEPPPSMQPNDPFFDSPIDPELLEEAYREVFGDDEPDIAAARDRERGSTPATPEDGTT
ncbi:hypothetical protein [Euzebya tangerina]|uniref:hypothetical protein n=1 Tax=Euzebya tangerina TaxID=591198 RepID=UPI000E31E0FD|nr:hypothetical protein [Euzebya tangerina]